MCCFQCGKSRLWIIFNVLVDHVTHLLCTKHPIKTQPFLFYEIIFKTNKTTLIQSLAVNTVYGCLTNNDNNSLNVHIRKNKNKVVGITWMPNNIHAIYWASFERMQNVRQCLLALRCCELIYYLLNVSGITSFRMSYCVCVCSAINILTHAMVSILLILWGCLSIILFYWLLFCVTSECSY